MNRRIDGLLDEWIIELLPPINPFIQKSINPAKIRVHSCPSVAGLIKPFVY